MIIRNIVTYDIISWSVDEILSIARLKIKWNLNKNVWINKEKAIALAKINWRKRKKKVRRVLTDSKNWKKK